MNRKVLFKPYLYACVMLLVFFAAGSGGYILAGGYTISGYLPKVERTSGEVTIKIDTLHPRPEKEFYLYYRTDGLKKYQVRKMEMDKTGKVYYRLSIDNLYGKNVEYFIVEAGKDVSQSISPVFTVTEITQKESPEIYFQDSTGADGTSGSKSKMLLPVYFGLSAQTAAKIQDNNDPPGKSFDANGNIRVYRNIYKENYQLDFDTNFTYTHNPSDVEEKINLSDMKLQFKTGEHTVAAGDLNINSTDFTTSAFSRRGIHYMMEGKTLYVSSFFSNSQQKTGFDGFGIPPADANVFGAAAGFNLGDFLKVRGMYITGKDNLDSKTIVSSDDAYREGHVISGWGEISLFQSKLVLKGEYAHSNYGSAENKDSVEKNTGTAWRAEADFNYNFITAHVDYKKVENTFSSIANLFLQNDWEGLNGSVGFMIDTFSLNLRYIDKKNHIDSEIQPMLHTKNIGIDFSWLIANHFQIGGEYSLDNLDYDESTGRQTGSEDMNTKRYAASVGYIAGANGITFKLGKTESENFTSNLEGTVAVNLMFGNFLSLNPTFTYQSTENFTDNSESKIYNGFLNGEITFIPEWFSLTVNGSYTKNNNSATDDSTTISAEGHLNLYLAKIFNQKVQPTFSLRGKYEEYKLGDTKADNTTLYLHFDLSF